MRTDRLNSTEYDLDRIYDSITTATGLIEVALMNGKTPKHCHYMSPRNTGMVEDIRGHNGEYFTWFVNCIEIYFPSWSIKLFRNGSIICYKGPGDAEYYKGMEALFDILKKCDYAPYLV